MAKTNYVLIDYENVQPKELTLLNDGSFKMLHSDEMRIAPRPRSGVNRRLRRNIAMVNFPFRKLSILACLFHPSLTYFKCS